MSGYENHSDVRMVLNLVKEPSCRSFALDLLNHASWLVTIETTAESIDVVKHQDASLGQASFDKLLESPFEVLKCHVDIVKLCY